MVSQQTATLSPARVSWFESKSVRHSEPKSGEASGPRNKPVVPEMGEALRSDGRHYVHAVVKGRGIPADCKSDAFGHAGFECQTRHHFS